jgi:predicted DNA-binding protein
MEAAGRSARGHLDGKYGPGSCGTMELEIQAMDLREIAGCLLREVVSSDEDDIEDLEDYLIAEEECERLNEAERRASRRAASAPDQSSKSGTNKTKSP